jgi:hypothetical protein
MAKPVGRVRESDRDGEFREQHEAIVTALDELFAHEVLVEKPPPKLRLVWPALEAIDRDWTGEGLRAFVVYRGQDLWELGGHLALFEAMRVVMAARPGHQAWNRTQLTALWADIGAADSCSGAVRPTAVREGLHGKGSARSLQLTD